MTLNILIHLLQKNSELSQLQKKTMAAVFWDCEAFLLCEFLHQKQQSKATSTVKQDKLYKAIEQKRPG
jgi:hypothetical protein